MDAGKPFLLTYVCSLKEKEQLELENRELREKLAIQEGKRTKVAKAGE